MMDSFIEGDFICHKYQVEKILHSDKEEILYKCKHHRAYRIVKEIFPPSPKTKKSF